MMSACSLGLSFGAVRSTEYSVSGSVSSEGFGGFPAPFLSHSLLLACSEADRRFWKTGPAYGRQFRIRGLESWGRLGMIYFGDLCNSAIPPF